MSSGSFSRKFFRNSKMSYLEQQHLIKFCRKHNIDFYEIDPALSYEENIAYLEQFIEKIPEQEKVSITELVREILQKNKHANEFDIYFFVAERLNETDDTLLQALKILKSRQSQLPSFESVNRITRFIRSQE